MKIAVVVGARPQLIKAATVSRCIRTRSDITEVLIHTGQHYDSNMSDVFFSELDIPSPDHHLAIGGGTHGENTGRMIEAIERVLTRESPDLVLVYGDTDSTLAGAIAAVKLNIPLAHVEAGLRSFNRRMPEEINRVLTDHAADLLFAPTETAVSNLAAEGLGGEKVRLVGDVMYDATLHYTSKARKPCSVALAESQPFGLCTLHRAENTNDHARLAAIVRALNRMAERIPLVLPLHPRTRSALERLANEELSDAIQVVEPVGFLEMTWLLNHCEMVITDSGGVQKEAYFHRKPCLTLRDETEWVELVDAGYNRLVSPNESDLFDAFEGMRAVAVSITPGLYGAGDAAERIVSILN
jgi:UDP-GlcNAc3NAcA epimerase